MRYSSSKIKLIVLSLTMIGMTLFASCGGDDDPSEEVRVHQLLTSGSWKLESVTVDGVNKNLYGGLSLTFTSTGFTSSGGEPVWPSGGIWTFVVGSAKSIARDDGVVVTIDEVTEATLILSLTWTENTLGSGRIQSVEGEHVFVMTKN
jgi:hypothetical protein